MGRRKKQKKHKQRSMYLNPDLDAINEALESDEKIRHLCPDPYCAGLGYPGSVCNRCRKSIPRGSQMPIKFPESARHKAKESQGTWTGGSTWTRHEHVGDKIVYEDSGKQLYAASGSGLRPSSGLWDLIIDLNHNVRMPRGFIEPISTDKYSALKKFTYGQDVCKSELLQLDWPDMGIAPATIDFWLSLWDMLPEKTVVACMGGHGRTGTCLVALMIASGYDYYSALEHVRKEHCKEAVETFGQEQYLHRLWMDYLKRLLPMVQSAETKQGLEEDLKYAAEHPPQSFSGHQKYANHGGPAVTTTYSTPTKTVSVPAQDWEGPEWKSVGGVVYVKECTTKGCITVGCAVTAHQGWLVWDPETIPHA